jgi:hypothetical protein
MGRMVRPISCANGQTEEEKNAKGLRGVALPSFHRFDPREFPSVCGINSAKKFLCSEVDHYLL